MNYKVTISNGNGRFGLYWAGAAASEVNILSNFLTGFYITRSWQRAALESPLSYFLLGETKVKKGLLREHISIDPDQVQSFTSSELLFTVLSKLSSITGISSFRSLAVHYSSLVFGLRSVPYVKDCDIFHVRSCFGRYCMPIAKEHGAICLVDHTIAHPNYLKKIADQESEYWGQKSDWQPQGIYWNTCIQDLDEADYVLTNSEFVSQTITQESDFPSNRIFVIPMGVDPELFRATPKNNNEESPSQFRFLYVGSLNYRKGILYLLEAWKKLNLKEAELIAVGALTNEVKPFLSQYENCNFTYIPHLPHSELSKIYQSADVFVFPSLAEGSAYVTYEAMGCGLPILTTFNAGSVMRDGIDGFLVPPRDIDALTDKLNWFYTHQSEAKEMGIAAAENISKNYSWKKYQERLLELYTKIY